MQSKKATVHCHWIRGGIALSIILVLAAFPLFSQRKAEEKPQEKSKIAAPLERAVNLDDLWFLQSSEKVEGTGEEISQPGFSIQDWYPAEVPSTVLGTLVDIGIYRDVFFGNNLDSIPEEPFQVSWWYRREFVTPPGTDVKSVLLEFDGINYRANIWLNGKRIAAAETTFGSFRRFSFDVTGVAKPGEKTVLAVEVSPPKPGEPTIGFVDWNPPAPDRNMGLWRGVRVKVTGEVSIHSPFVKTKLNLEKLDKARLTVSVEVRNHSAEKKEGDLIGEILRSRFSQKVELEPNETKVVVFSPENYPELNIEDPKVWWTHDLGDPNLYLLRLIFRADKKVSDITATRFGIREVSDYLDEKGHRGYLLNGKKILIRGGGWVDDIFLNVRLRKLRAEIQYARHMNLNALRLEGFWGTSSALYDLCDEYGIFLMAGWSCHWEWENYFGKPVDERYGGILSDEDMDLVAKSWEDQIKWLRNHPSIFVWAQASDLLPKPELEERYRAILKENDPTRPTLVSTADRTSSISGKSGVKMFGPYDYVPPVYWYADKTRGGAYGFNTETGPGPQVPPVESIRKMIPKENLWPIDDIWNFHCCRGEFNNLDRYNEAMDRRLGTSSSVEEYARKAQFLNYEGMRAMFEAFVANKPQATGIIQWMYNSAWPKLWWQLYDYYLMPTGAFYGARKAGQPVHILFNYDTREIIAVNNTLEPATKLKALITLYDFELREKYTKTVEFSLSPDEVHKLDVLPTPEELTTTYFLDLRLSKEKGNPIDINFYCLSTVKETLDEANATWFVTPVKDYADLTALNDLGPASLRVRDKYDTKGPVHQVSVEIENRSKSLAFQVELQILRDGSREVVLPIFWEDNYITLLPGEKRKIEGTFYTDDLRGEKPLIQVKGWNIEE